MAISYVGGNSLGQAGVTATTDITIDLTALTGGSDSAPITGDLVIVSLGVGDADGVDGDMTETSGLYTEVADVFAGAGATNEANLGVFYKFMTATPDTSVSVRSNLGNDAGISLAVMVFRGVKTVAAGGPFDVAAVPTSGTGTGAIDPPQIDTTGAAGIWTVIAGTRAMGTGTGAFTGPTGYTTDFVDAAHGVDTVDAKTGMGYNTAPADPENPGTIVWSGTEASTDSWCAVTMALSEHVDASVSVTPGTASLTTATFAPTVTASDNKTVTPSTLALTTATFAPTVTATANVLVTPGTAALLLATFAPTVTVGTPNVTVTPSTASLTLSLFAPTVSVSDNKTVTPTTAALTTATFAPTVTATANVQVTPSTLALTLTGFAPTVTGYVGLADSPLNFSLALPAGATLPQFSPSSGYSDSRLAAVQEYLSEVEQWMADSLGEGEEMGNFRETGFEADFRFLEREE